MKFFTTEWQNSWDPSSTKEERKKLKEKTDKIISEYEKQFDKIKPKLSKKFITLYNKYGRFHDCEIKELLIKRRKGKTKPLVDLTITLNINNILYQLKYGAVSKIEYRVNCLDDNIDFLKWGNQFDVWMYDEFSLAPNDTIQHEISFLSNGELIIVFKRISLEKL